MKARKNIRLVTLLAGVLTALVIGYTQMFYAEVSQEQTSDTEQHSAASSQDEEHSILLPASYSIPSSTHVVLQHDFSFIEEILLAAETDEQAPVALQLATGKLFRALFHYIISPNAP
jgi:FlaG/FlaF family flagellin (archaellin)